MLTQSEPDLDQVADYLTELARMYPWQPTKEPLHPRHRRSIKINGVVYTLQLVLVHYGVRQFLSLKIMPRSHVRPSDELCKYLLGYFFKGDPEDTTEITNYSHPAMRTFLSECLDCDHQCDGCPAQPICQEVSV